MLGCLFSFDQTWLRAQARISSEKREAFLILQVLIGCGRVAYRSGTMIFVGMMAINWATAIIRPVYC
jgi:hypothetical protein